MIVTLAVGIATGFVYALVAMGYSLVYRTTGVVNFTAGSYVVLGGLGTWWLLSQAHFPYGLAVFGGIILAGAVAGVFWTLVVIPLWRRGSPAYVVLLSTVIGGAILAPLTDLLITPQAEELPPWVSGFTLHISGSDISGQYVFVVVAGLAMVTGVSLFLRKTILGKQLRACGASRETSRLLGINPGLAGGIIMVITGLIGGLAGALITPAQSSEASMGLTFGVFGFVAAAFGGLDSVAGAFIGGILLGTGQAFIDRYYTPNYDEVIVFALLVVVLVLRPSGLFGNAEHAG
jgi:branched-chain amino acid transport system permease protein